MKISRQGNVARIVQVILVLGAAFAFYHFYYLEQRREALHERNLRELASVARQLEDSLATWNEVVANFLIHDSTLGFPVPLRPAELAEPAAAGTGSAGAVDTFQAGWEVARGPLQGARVRVLESPPPGDDPPPWIDVRPRGRVHWVSFTQFHGGRWLEVHLRLRRVVDRIDLPERMFDQLLLLDHRGRVLVRRGDPEVRITGLSLGDPPPNHAHQAQQALGGHQWEVFAQPVLLTPIHSPPGAPLETLTWHLAGLVDSQQLETESAALPPPVLVLMVCALLLLVLLLPIFKVWLLARHERVRRLDLLTLAVASAAAMALLAVLVADLYAFGSLEAALDDSLESLTEELAADVRAELEAMQDQLQILLDAGLGSEEGVRAGLLAAPPPGTPPLADWPYPWLEAAAWITPDGQQRSRWTVAEDASGRISVADRAYFRRVLAGSTWQLGQSSRPPVVLEPIQSLISGHRLAALAMPVTDGAAGESLAGVAVLTARPLTFMEPVLPVDVGFAVVEPDGRVLFHSDPARNGRGDWIAACDEDPRVAQAIRHRTRTVVDVQYQGRPVRAHIEPLLPLPLSLVVFHDRDPLQRLHLDLLLWILATALVFLTLLTLGAVALATAWYLGRGRREWLLGSGERFENADLRLVAVLCLLAVSLLCVLVEPELTSKLVFALVLPAVAVLFFLARLAWKRSRTRRPWLEILPLALWLLVILGDLGLGLGTTASWSAPTLAATLLLWAAGAFLWWRAQDPDPLLSSRLGTWIREGGGVVLNSLLFFVVAAALPTALVFQVLWQAEQWTLVSRHQRWLAGQLEARVERVQRDLAEPQRALPAEGAGDLLASRLAFPSQEDPWDRRDPPFEPGAPVPPHPSIFAVHVEVVDSCPFLQRASTEFHAGEASSAGQLLWHQLQGLHARLPLRQARTLEGSDNGPGLSGFWRADLTAEGHVRLHVASPRGDGCLHLVSPGISPRRPALGLPLVVMLLGIAYLTAIGQATRRLLTFDLAVADGPAEQPPGRDWLLWIGSPEAACCTFPAPADGQMHLDLSRADGRQRLTEEAGDSDRDSDGDRDSGGEGRSPAPDGRVPEDLRQAHRLVLLGVDSILHDRRCLGELLRFLERLLETGHPPAVVLVLSAPLQVDALLTLMAEAPAEGRGAPPECSEPWPAQRVLAVLGGFIVYSTDRLGAPATLPVQDLTGPTPDIPDSVVTALSPEAGDNPHLQRIAAWLAASPGIGQRSRHRLVDAFREAADLYYRWLWSRIQEDERLALFHLAEEELINPAAEDTARRLVRRGLAAFVPYRGLRSLNSSFRQWVRQRADEDDLQRLEQGPGGWAQARRPLVVALLAVLVFLLSTQQDLVGDTLGDLHKTLVQSVAVITAVVSALAGLGQLLPQGKGLPKLGGE